MLSKQIYIQQQQKARTFPEAGYALYTMSRDSMKVNQMCVKRRVEAMSGGLDLQNTEMWVTLWDLGVSISPLESNAGIKWQY